MQNCTQTVCYISQWPTQEDEKRSRFTLAQYPRPVYPLANLVLSPRLPGWRLIKHPCSRCHQDSYRIPSLQRGTGERESHWERVRHPFNTVGASAVGGWWYALPAVSVEQSLLASLSRITTCVVVVRAKSSWPKSIILCTKLALFHSVWWMWPRCGCSKIPTIT